jgi:hypothetical protein
MMLIDHTFTHFQVAVARLLRAASFLLALDLIVALPTSTAQAYSANDGFNPGANSSVWTLAVQADGKILVGGFFMQLGGQTRNYIARLSSPTAALYSLEVSGYGTTLAWQRPGAAPEVTRVEFEWSTNGVQYTPLGAGARARGGW